MESFDQLNKEILQITSIIRERHPELLKYLNEMPITLPDEQRPEVSESTLLEYRDSLRSLLKRYEEEIH